MPQLVTSSESKTVSTGQNANVGFFGDTPTAGFEVSRSASMTTSVSYATPTVAAEDHNHGPILVKTFVMHQNVGDDQGGLNDPARNPGSFDFNTTVAEIFRVPDDKHGLRNTETTVRAFEIALSCETILKKVYDDEDASEIKIDVFGPNDPVSYILYWHVHHSN
jgi:hypothetical protein